MNVKKPVNPMHLAPRCRAHSKRSGHPCQAPAVRGHRVCRMHGAGGGAPEGRANGSYRHGRFTVEAIEQWRELNAWIRSARMRAEEIA